MATNTATTGQQLFARARQALPGGVSSSFRAAVKPEPLFIERAEGVRVVDADGMTHLDFMLAWGPLILGHGHPAIISAVGDQLARGHMYGAQHRLEIEVGERLQAVLPCADRVTFSNSGSEAVQVAFRLARAYTGRPKILKFEGHYHGWSDAALVSYHPSADDIGARDKPHPVPGTNGQSTAALSEIIVAPWNDIDALADVMQRHNGEIAAVVMEPVLCNSGVISPRDGYLVAVRALTQRHGSLLIFDEVITGFRLALGGAQEVYTVVPDLAVYAKAISAGFPLSAVAGRLSIMELIANGTVAHSGTYNGNPVCLAATAAALQELSQPGVYERLHAMGTRLADGARSLLTRHGIAAVVHQNGPVMQILFTDRPALYEYRDVMACDAALNAELVQELRAHGVLILPDGRWYLSAVHTDSDIDEALHSLDLSLTHLAVG